MARNLFRRGGDIWHYRFRRNGLDFEGSTFTNDLLEAQARLDARRSEVIAREFDRYPSRTILDAIHRFGDERYPHLKPRTRDRYDVSFLCVVPVLGDIPIRRLGTADLTRFEDTRRRQGVSASTVRRDLAFLSGVISAAQVWEWCEANIVRSFLKERRRAGLTDGEPRRRILSDVEEAAILRHLRPEALGGILLALDAGLRREEILSLRWTDIDLARAEIRIRGEIAKSGRDRVVPLWPRVLAHLKKLPRREGCPFVFVSRYGRRHAPSSRFFNTALAKAATLAGFDLSAPICDLRLHDLRRTCGHRLLAKHAWQMHEVQLLLGHASVQQTERAYAVVGAAEVRAAFRRTMVNQRPAVPEENGMSAIV